MRIRILHARKPRIADRQRVKHFNEQADRSEKKTTSGRTTLQGGTLVRDARNKTTYHGNCGGQLKRWIFMGFSPADSGASRLSQLRHSGLVIRHSFGDSGFVIASAFGFPHLMRCSPTE
jgi:hypothetical protein